MDGVDRHGQKRLADKGGIALQVHGGGDFTKQFVRYRNIRVKELPAPPAGSTGRSGSAPTAGISWIATAGPSSGSGTRPGRSLPSTRRREAEAYLANRSQKGFTVIQGVLAWGLGSGFEGKVPLANANGDKPWLNDDPRTPNDAYFRHVDALLESANKQGLVLAMLPTWGYYVNDVPVIDAAKARVYGRWLGARYKNAPNLIWVNGGDRIATGFEDVYRELARGLREGDGGAHLITYHPAAGGPRRSTSTATPGSAST